MRSTFRSIRDNRSTRQFSEAAAISASISARRSITPSTSERANSRAGGPLSKLSQKSCSARADCSSVISNW
jgi:hypothetical protein